jgi:hypothetical protein
MLFHLLLLHRSSRDDCARLRSQARSLVHTLARPNQGVEIGSKMPLKVAHVWISRADDIRKCKVRAGFHAHTEQAVEELTHDRR